MRPRRHILLLAALWVALGVSACAKDPALGAAATRPADDVLRLIYNRMLQFDTPGAHGVAVRALERGDLAERDRLRIEFAKAVALENYQPKSDTVVAEAQALFQSIAKRSPELAPAALIHVARSYEVQISKPDPTEARRVYEDILRTYPDSPQTAEATLRLGVNLIWSWDAPSRRRGRERLEAFVREHPKHDLAVSMHLALADSAIARQAYEDGLDHLIAAFDGGILPHKRRTQAVYQIGNIAYLKLKRLDVAEKYYAIAVKDYWNWGGAYEARQNLEAIRKQRAARAAGGS